MRAETEAKTVPRWVLRVVGLTWYEWIAWIIQAVLVATFIIVTITQFQEDESRAGWIMILLTILFGGPGFWVLLKYRPKAGSKFNAFDVGAIICFAVWAVLLLYLILPLPEIGSPTPFGSPVQ